MKILFDEPSHRYTNDNNEGFISVTTKLKTLTNTFDADTQAVVCAKIGANPSHPKYLKYKGFTANDLLEKWRLQNALGCEQGTNTHLWLERTINRCCSYTQYNLIRRSSKKELILIEDICKCKLKPNVLLKRNSIQQLLFNAPEIYNRILEHCANGRTVLTEVLTVHPINKIAGQIDLIAINQKDKTFIIDDWKTNNAPIIKESGYFEKDINGQITTTFRPKWLTMKDPLSHLPDSKYHQYSMQLSMYAYLVELATGYTCVGLRIYHIRNAAQIAVVFQTDVHYVQYLKEECISLLNYN